MKVKIPKGISLGRKLKIMGKGYPKRIKDGNAGDLLFIINYKSDDYFKYNNGHYYINVMIDFEVWFLGGDIEIATFSGLKKIKILPMASLEKASLVPNEELGTSKLLIFLSLDENIIKDKDVIQRIKDLGLLIKEKGLNNLVEIFNKETIKKIEEIENEK